MFSLGRFCRGLDRVAFGHLVVEDKLMVFPVALQDMRALHLENLKNWMQMNDIRLGILANFSFTRLDLVFLRI